MPTAELPACVFCGEPIDPGEEAAGRAPMAAHAACADAALASDEHWEAIDAAGTEGENHAPDHGTAARAGCLGVMALCVVALAVAWRSAGRESACEGARGNAQPRSKTGWTCTVTPG